MSPSRRNQLLYSLYVSGFYWEQSLWSILPGRIVVLKVLVKHFFFVCDSLLALTFIISSADRLLVQVDDSELSKLILIQAAVIITQYEHKHTAAAGGVWGHAPSFVHRGQGGAKWPGIDCLHMCNHILEKPGFAYGN